MLQQAIQSFSPGKTFVVSKYTCTVSMSFSYSHHYYLVVAVVLDSLDIQRNTRQSSMSECGQHLLHVVHHIQDLLLTLLEASHSPPDKGLYLSLSCP